MLRHKAIIQCARVAFGFVGIHDEDEGKVIADAEYIEVKPPIAMPEEIKKPETAKTEPEPGTDPEEPKLTPEQQAFVDKL